MAIAKIGSAGKSAGAINYVLSENRNATKQPEILAGSFGTPAEIKQEFEIYNKLNSRVKNQATHISISFAAGERVEAKKKIEFAKKLLEKLDFKNVPFLVVEHHDKEYEHFHIIAGRIRDDGTTVKEWKIAERTIEATKELERTFGLEQTRYVKSGDRQIKSREYKRMERTGELSVMAEAKLVIDEVLQTQSTVKNFVERLQKSGFEVRPNISETTDRMNGFSFKKGTIKFKSSAIAKNYSWKNLLKNGLNYDRLLDTKYLKEVKNELTEKLNLESGRNDRIETAKSVANRTESITGRAEPELNQSKSTFGSTDRPKVESSRIEFPGRANYDSTTEFNETASFQRSVETARESTSTKVSDDIVYEDRHRGERTTSEDKSRANSGIGKSTDGIDEINVIFTEPKLNPAPKREADRTNLQNRRRELEHERSRSR